MDQNLSQSDAISSGKNRVRRVATATAVAVAALSGFSAFAYVSVSSPGTIGRFGAFPQEAARADSAIVIGLRVSEGPGPDFTLVQAPASERRSWFTNLAVCLEQNNCPTQSAESSISALDAEARALWTGAPLPLNEPEDADHLATTLAAGDPALSDAAPEASVSEAPATDAANSVVIARRVPLPVSRPPELHTVYRPDLAHRSQAAALQAQALPSHSARQAPAHQMAAPAGPVVDNRSAFERLFTPQQQPASPAMAYAALETNPIEGSPSRAAISPAPAPPAMPIPRAGGGTAVYDISSRSVTLPNGERLEAHSGLGDNIDDPRTVHMRGRGATPPGTYDLKMREKSFHGVQAIRMTPVGGSAAIHGRDGILAHHYLRGPSGESSGCVSFKHYNRFLQAYQRGEVSRVVVVTGGSQNPVSSFVSRLFGGS